MVKLPPPVSKKVIDRLAAETADQLDQPEVRAYSAALAATLLNRAPRRHKEPKSRTHELKGTIRHKRSDTTVGTLREIYGPEFARGSRADTKLGALLDQAGAESLGTHFKRKK